MRNEDGFPMCEWCGLSEASPVDILCVSCVRCRVWEAPARQPQAHSERAERALVLLQGTLKRSARLIRSRQEKEANRVGITTGAGDVRRGAKAPRVHADRATLASRGTASNATVGRVCEMREGVPLGVNGLRWPVIS